MTDSDLSPEDINQADERAGDVNECPICQHLENDACDHDDNDIHDWEEEDKTDSMVEAYEDKMDSFDDNFGGQ